MTELSVLSASLLPSASDAETCITEVAVGTKGRGVDSFSQCDKAN